MADRNREWEFKRETV